MAHGEWDEESVSRSFQYKAESTERYLKEIGPKMRERPTYKTVYDMYLAEFYVYNSLHGKAFLRSRDALLAELERMLSADAPHGYGANDQDAFARYRKNHIRAALANFSNATR